MVVTLLYKFVSQAFTAPAGKCCHACREHIVSRWQVYQLQIWRQLHNAIYALLGDTDQTVEARVLTIASDVPLASTPTFQAPSKCRIANAALLAKMQRKKEWPCASA
jgi:hypothetical protein